MTICSLSMNPQFRSTRMDSHSVTLHSVEDEYNTWTELCYGNELVHIGFVPVYWSSPLVQSTGPVQQLYTASIYLDFCTYCFLFP